MAGAHRNAEPIYDFPRKRIARHAVADSPLRVSALRSLGAYANVFAIESFMDELRWRPMSTASHSACASVG